MLARRLATRYARGYPGLAITDVRIVAGVAWESIFRSANALGSNLIVLGPHNEPSVATALPKSKGTLGSTADGVIRHARCPVMIINPAFKRYSHQFRKIVVGIDFSRPCASALCLAALLAAHFDCRIYPFHMLPIPPYPKYTPETFKADFKRIRVQLETLCRQMLQGVAHHIHIKTGTIPHAALMRHARKMQADLIVIGSHVKEKAGKWYPGSVTHQLSAQANCPVMVVSGPRALAHWKEEPCVEQLSSMKFPPLTLYPV
jgi:nucleotide-binding universal stress UspA family protein